jgi:hypothetical protein
VTGLISLVMLGEPVYNLEENLRINNPSLQATIPDVPFFPHTHPDYAVESPEYFNGITVAASGIDNRSASLVYRIIDVE